MNRPRFTNKAVDDLSEIWNYTFKFWSEKQADLYYQMLISTCQKIANEIELGEEYNQISKGLFGIKMKRHIIFYRVIHNDSVEITRILHERMDLRRHILDLV